MDQFIRDFHVENYNTYELEADNYAILDKNNISNGNLSIFHTNIRSIAKNFDELQVFLSQFNESFDIIVLTETWKIIDINLYQITNYEVISNENQFNQNDGIIMYIKKNLNFSSISVKISEVNALEVKIKINKQMVNVLGIYRPPSTCPLSFIDHLSMLLRNKNSEYNILIGDINIDILSENIDYSTEYLNVMSENGFYSLINKYTRVNATSKSCIDHIFLKARTEHNDNIYAAVIKSNITDHYPVVTIIKNIGTKPNNVNYKIIHKIDDVKLNNLLKYENWIDLYESIDTENSTKLFIETFKQHVTNSTRTIKIKETIKRKPWITNGIILSMRVRDKLYQEYIKNPSNELKKQKYTTYRNKINSLVKTIKNKYFQNKIEKNSKSSKHIWDTVNESLNGNQKIKKPINSITVDNQDIYNKLEIANSFNKYFTEVGETLANKIHQPTNNDNDYITIENTTPNSMFLSPTNCEEIKNIITNLKNGKSPGIDQISNELLKKCVDHIIEPLTYIINQCILSGQVPSYFKTAIIKPIFKNGDHSKMSNYRPISLVSALAKIFEKIIKARLCNYLAKHQIIHNMQFGFRENKSTQDAITALTSKIYNAMDHSKPAICVFVDLAKAFDTVSHKLLLEKLEKLGIRGNTLQLFRNYLTNRKQMVMIDDIMSNEKTVIYGVPQGTVLGPVLFTIYINDLLTLSTESNIISYADDTAIFFEGDNWQELRQVASTDLKKIKKWFDKNLLTLNWDKTKYLTFTSYKKYLPEFDTIPIDDREIYSTTSIKYLGITIDSHLRWDIQIQNIIHKIRHLSYKFKILKSFLNIKQLKIIYYALVESILQYGIIAWGGVKKSYLMPLEILQKRIMKIMFNKITRFPSDELYHETKILDIRQIYSKIILVYLYKNKNNLRHLDHSYCTRRKHNELIKTDMAKKDIGRRYFIYQGQRLYNELPINIRDSKSIAIFKKLINKWLREQERSRINAILNL